MIAHDGCYPLPGCQLCPLKVATRLSTPTEALELAPTIEYNVGTLNFVITFSEQNWRVFGLSSPTLPLELLTNTRLCSIH